MARKKNNSNHPREIDKSKKSNRRCGNCAHYKEKNAGDIYDGCKCGLTGKPKQYYHCCKKFAWRTDRKYTGEASSYTPGIQDANFRNTVIRYFTRGKNNFRSYCEVIVSGIMTIQMAEDIFRATANGKFIPDDVGMPTYALGAESDWYEFDGMNFYETTYEPSCGISAKELHDKFIAMKSSWEYRYGK